MTDNTHSSIQAGHPSGHPFFNLREYLTSPVAHSPRQAALQQAYLGWRRLSTNPLAMIGLSIILVLILTAIFAPLLATHSPFAQDLSIRLRPSSSEHIFGTDELGRDIYSRIVYGARITLYMVMLVAIIVGPIGLVLGITAGFFGGWIDTIIMRLVDLFLAIPGLILALAFVAALGPGILNAVIAISITAWPPITRLARAETLTVRASDYIAAVRIQGASSLRMIIVHILPMCLPSVIVRITLNMPFIILVAAGLGFLGLGAQPPSPEWGAMLSTGRTFLLNSWWLAAIPGIAIMVVSVGFNLLGDELRDLIDPRNR